MKQPPATLFFLLLLMLALFGGGGWLLLRDQPATAVAFVPVVTPGLGQPTAAQPTPVPPSATIPPTSTLWLTPTATPPATPSATPTATPTLSPTTAVFGTITTLGYSAGGRPIQAYQFNSGPDKIVLVGGMHGGYEWNTIVLAYEAIDFFLANPELVPDTVTLFIIPAVNPDGQFRVVGKNGRFAPLPAPTETATAPAEATAPPAEPTPNTLPGRFNDNGVDLNRNWDCLWQPTAQLRDRAVDPGSHPFSEPETIALRDFFLAQQPKAVVFWHSVANGAYAASCPELYPPSFALATLYGNAARYPINEAFTSYPISGDASDWLASQNIPAITIELRTAYRTDWAQNQAGILALLNGYSTTLP
ncbi:MAG: hypothetical protein KDE56_25730 [Anaerolineales bacterium]|nr:hypothetical protein [Anaerolineales bacterium]